MLYAMKDFYAYIKDKTVSVVCPAEYMVGLGKGKEIDAHDIVVRVKYLPKNIKDYGGRSDVIYHHFSEKRVNISMLLKQYDQANVKWLLHKLEKRIDPTMEQAENYTFKWACVENERKILNKVIKKGANTGVLAVYTILQGEPKKLSLYGMDFYRSGYGPTKNKVDVPINDAWGIHETHHNAESQIKLLRLLVETFDNFVVDDILREVLYA